MQTHVAHQQSHAIQDAELKSAHHPPQSTFVVTLTPYRCSLSPQPPWNTDREVCEHGSDTWCDSGLFFLNLCWGLYNSRLKASDGKMSCRQIIRHPIFSPFWDAVEWLSLVDSRSFFLRPRKRLRPSIAQVGTVDKISHRNERQIPTSTSSPLRTASDTWNPACASVARRTH